MPTQPHSAEPKPQRAMSDWVLAAERAYVAAAVGDRGYDVDRSPRAGDAPSSANAAAPGSASTELRARAIAAAGAVASRYLAVGTPRSFGIVIDDVAEVAVAALSLVAHHTWFAPRDVRCASVGTGTVELAAATAGRAVSVDEALACDIVNVYSARVRIAPPQLRRGTHVNALTADVIDPELLGFATVTREAGLPALAAGLVDGRQLDEITIFLVDGAPIALAASASPA
jgi:hypothetical protein